MKAQPITSAPSRSIRRMPASAVGAAGGQQVVDDQHLLPRLDRVVMDFDGRAPVFQRVVPARSSSPAACPSFAHRHEPLPSGAPPPAEDEAPRLQDRHMSICAPRKATAAGPPQPQPARHPWKQRGHSRGTRCPRAGNREWCGCNPERSCAHAIGGFRSLLCGGAGGSAADSAAAAPRHPAPRSQTGRVAVFGKERVLIGAGPSIVGGQAHGLHDLLQHDRGDLAAADVLADGDGLRSGSRPPASAGPPARWRSRTRRGPTGWCRRWCRPAACRPGTAARRPRPRRRGSGASAAPLALISAMAWSMGAVHEVRACRRGSFSAIPPTMPTRSRSRRASGQRIIGLAHSPPGGGRRRRRAGRTPRPTPGWAPTGISCPPRHRWWRGQGSGQGAGPGSHRWTG